ncbi:DUF3987 domain-containing protein [Thalassotalea sp. SU-HH00458]|uniref:DUF3987 domain-containing protein n=1 Tax=Thalassotalea sp. SU-HH00458 TaxID=3127657 RepID=UPI0031091B63
MNSLIPVDRAGNSLIQINQQFVYYKSDSKRKKIEWKRDSGLKAKKVNASGYNLTYKVDAESNANHNVYVFAMTMVANIRKVEEFIDDTPLKPFLITHLTPKRFHIIYAIENCNTLDGDKIAKATGERLNNWKLNNISATYIPIAQTKYWAKGKSYTVKTVFSMGAGYDAKYFVERMSLDIWLTPLSLNDQPDCRTQINDNCLPKFLLTFAKSVAKSIACPLDNVVIPMLVMLASLIHHKIHIQPNNARNFLLAINLWGVVIMLSGSKKSPPLRYLIDFLKPLQEQANDKYFHEKKSFERLQKKNALTNKTIEREAEKLLKEIIGLSEDDPEKMQINYDVEELLKGLQDTKQKCPQKLYTLADFTPAAFVEKMIQNPNGLLLQLDELFQLFEKLSRKENESLRGFFLALFESFGVYDKALKTEEQRDCSDRTISIIGSTQPDKIRPMIAKAISGTDQNDGFFNRFQLLVCPQPIATIESQTHDIDPALEVEFRNFVNTLDKSNLGFAKDTKLTEKRVQFSSNAQSLFDQFSIDNELSIQKLLSGNGNEVIASHYNKYPALVAKLATLFNLASIFDANKQLAIKTVRSKYVSQAINFVNYLKSHANFILSSETNITHKNAEKILSSLARFDDGHFTTADIKRFDWSGLGRDTKAIQDALNFLVEMRVLKKGKATKANSERWLINPLYLTK